MIWTLYGLGLEMPWAPPWPVATDLPCPFGVLRYDESPMDCEWELIHRARDPFGTLEVFRSGDAFRIAYKDVEIVFTPTHFSITGDPAEACALMERVAAPLYVHLSNETTLLHGSAVVVAGTAVVFLGESGQGKSSTAHALAEAGHPLLADDYVLISDGDVISSGGFARLRTVAGQGELDPATGKWRVRMPTSARTPVKDLVHLNRGDQTALSPVGGVSSLRLVLSASLILNGRTDHETRLSLARRLVERVNVWTFDYQTAASGKPEHIDSFLNVWASRVS